MNMDIPFCMHLFLIGMDKMIYRQIDSQKDRQSYKKEERYKNKNQICYIIYYTRLFHFHTGAIVIFQISTVNSEMAQTELRDKE